MRVLKVRRSPGRGSGTRGERGSMAVEIVILAPVMMLFVLLIVMFGRYVAVRGDVDAAARDAVRAASLETTRAQGAAAASAVVAQSLDSQSRSEERHCSTTLLPGWGAGETITVRVRCKVSYEGLGLLGVPGSTEMVSESSAPLDPYRRFGSP